MFMALWDGSARVRGGVVPSRSDRTRGQVQTASEEKPRALWTGVVGSLSIRDGPID